MRIYRDEHFCDEGILVDILIGALHPLTMNTLLYCFCSRLKCHLLSVSYKHLDLLMYGPVATFDMTKIH